MNLMAYYLYSVIRDTPMVFLLHIGTMKKNGHIYFHGAKEGHKMDCLKQRDKASFCVMDKGFKKDGEIVSDPAGINNDGK